MFIKKDNTLKWNWIIVGALIIGALIFCGIYWGDKTLTPLICNKGCWPTSNNWLCSVVLVIGKIFIPKVWLWVSALSVIFFFIYKAVRNEFDFRYAFVKIKNSYVFYIFCAVFLAYFTTGFLKILIGRSRPYFEGIPHFEPFNYDKIFHSMPSGHTAISFAGLVMIGMLFPRIKWATWTMAIIIGVSRVYVCAHWPSDVLFGAFVGMLCADLVKAALRKINTK